MTNFYETSFFQLQIVCFFTKKNYKNKLFEIKKKFTKLKLILKFVFGCLKVTRK